LNNWYIFITPGPVWTTIACTKNLNGHAVYTLTSVVVSTTEIKYVMYLGSFLYLCSKFDHVPL